MEDPHPHGFWHPWRRTKLMLGVCVCQKRRPRMKVQKTATPRTEPSDSVFTRTVTPGILRGWDLEQAPSRGSGASQCAEPPRYCPGWEGGAGAGRGWRRRRSPGAAGGGGGGGAGSSCHRWGRVGPGGSAGDVRARGPDMGPTSPAARGQGRRWRPPPLPLLLPLSLLLLRAQLAVGNLAVGSPSAAEVRPGRVLGMGKGRDRASTWTRDGHRSPFGQVACPTRSEL
jgi:hypothetical protein